MKDLWSIHKFHSINSTLEENGEETVNTEQWISYFKTDEVQYMLRSCNCAMVKGKVVAVL